MTAELFTAAETLGLIIYGDPRAFDGLPPGAASGAPALHETWGAEWIGFFAASRRHPLIFSMRWALARVRWRLTRARRRGGWRRCPLPPLERRRRAHLRRLWHAHGRRPMAVLLAQLRADLARAARAEKEQAAALRRASAEIAAAVCAGRLHPLGRRGAFAAGAPAALDHEPVPPGFFAHPHRVVTRDGWATLDLEGVGNADYRLWRDAPAPDWGDLRFPAAEVRRLWAPGAKAAGAGGLAVAREWMDRHVTKAQGPPPKRDLTLKACCAATGCTWREALAAWNEAPPDRKRAPRETDRALARRA